MGVKHGGGQKIHVASVDLIKSKQTREESHDNQYRIVMFEKG